MYFRLKWIWVPVVLVWGLNLLLRFSGVSVWDDAYFFIRYADNFLEWGSYGWNPMEPATYGLSSPLYGGWVLFWRWVLPISPAAVLWWCSFSAGMVAIGSLFGLFNHSHGLRGAERSMAWRGATSVLLLTAPQWAVHFSSGMDTTFAIALLTLTLWTWQLWTQKESWFHAVVLGLLAGLLAFARPELVLIGLGLPLFLVFDKWRKRESPQQVLAVLGMVLLVLALGLWWAWESFGSLLPLSFYIKSRANHYGADMAWQYRLAAWKNTFLFVLAHFPFFLVIPATVFIQRRSGAPYFLKSEKALMGLVGVFLLYQTFVVLPIMGYDQRFLYPVVPALWLFYGRATGLQVVNRDPSRKMENQRNWFRIYLLTALLGVFLTVYQRPPNLRTTWGGFDMETVYQELGRNNWPGLDRVAPLSEGMSVATTELGIPGVMLPKAEIADLSGLMDPVLSQDFDAGYVLNYRRPDLIYLPHPDYVPMRKALLEHPDFRRLYHHFSEEDLSSWMGMAVRKDSPLAPELLEIAEAIQLDAKN